MHDELEQRRMHEALLRARADSPRPTDEDVAAYLDGTIPDEGVRARVLGEIGVDPVLTEALLAEEGRGASLVESRPKRLGGPRLAGGSRGAWRRCWWSPPASFIASDPDVERRRGCVELLEDGVVEGTDPMGSMAIGRQPGCGGWSRRGFT